MVVVEGNVDESDKLLTLLLGSGTNKGRAEAVDGDSGRSFGIFEECCCSSDSCWFLHCFRWKSIERERDKILTLLVAFGFITVDN